MGLCFFFFFKVSSYMKVCMFCFLLFTALKKKVFEWFIVVLVVNGF